MKRPIIVLSIATGLLIAGLGFVFAQGDVQPPRGEAAALIEPDASPLAMTAMTQNVTINTCSNAWYDSQAKAFCSSTDTSVTSNNQCYLARECGSEDQNVTYTGSPNNVKRLHWCHPSNQAYGYLKVGDC